MIDLDLVVDVIGERETSKRVEVIKRRLDFEAEPEKFIKKYLVEEEELKNRIENSKKRLNNIKCSD